MRINDDLFQPIILHTTELEWVPSPAAGVERRMLYRVGDEVARATSIVRYAPNSTFPPHTHNGGEEILVLAGTFQDEHGDYPAGSYFRNPPGTSHTPAAKEGCTIFVKLWQFREGDHAQMVRLNNGAGELFNDGYENVRLETWQASEAIMLDSPRGIELLVLEGSLVLNGETLSKHSWARFPAGYALAIQAGAQGATVWLKDAPLEHENVLQMRR